jgi:hypothetical protein
LEDWKDILNDKLNYAFPMVCFCDIPLSQTTIHARQYGSFAIGMTKAWGERNKVNPVLYTYRNSATATYVSGSFGKLKEVNTDLEKLFNTVGSIREVRLRLEHLSFTRTKLQDDIYTLAKYLKPYQGRFWNKYIENFSNKRVNYYNEREWRYIPHSVNPQAINEREFRDKRLRDIYNEKACKHKLTFELSDIKHIIIGKETDIPIFANKIFTKFKRKCAFADLLPMITRIISMDQVLSDL